jgi:hypothetical protein
MVDNFSHAARVETSLGSRKRPLPVTIVPGMRVIDVAEEDIGTILGVTQAFCIFPPVRR